MQLLGGCSYSRNVYKELLLRGICFTQCELNHPGISVALTTNTGLSVRIQACCRAFRFLDA
jgi:hypothetical protein